MARKPAVPVGQGNKKIGRALPYGPILGVILLAGSVGPPRPGDHREGGGFSK